jgi:hypothetical protein
MTEPLAPAADAPAATDAPATPTPAPAAAAPEPTTDANTDPAIQAQVDEAAKKASRDANREAAALRKRLKEYEDAEEARKTAALSETERLQKERDDATKAAAAAQEQARAAFLRAEVATASVDLKIVDPEAALALMDHTKVTWSDDGKPEGVAEALTALAAVKPYLVAKPGTPTLDPSNGGRGGAPDLTPQQQTEALWRHRSKAAVVWGSSVKS